MLYSLNYSLETSQAKTYQQDFSHQDVVSCAPCVKDIDSFTGFTFLTSVKMLITLS